MNNRVLLLRNYLENDKITQRQLAADMELSLGTVNSLIAQAEEDGFLSNGKVTKNGMTFLSDYKVDRAVIFACGFGSRFVPLTWETPKGLLAVFGEPMIERQIKQLHEVGIKDITVMVGYMKEKFEYLKKKFGVKLRYNDEYDTKNTLATLYHARDLFEGKNSYLLYSDNWLRENMFHEYEPNAWYTSIFHEGRTSEWPFIFNKKNLITKIKEGGADEWIMFGPVYFSKEFSSKFLPVMEQYYNAPATENDYLEQIMLDWLNSSDRIVKLNAKDFPELYVNKQPNGQVHELDSLEEMQEFDEYYKSNDVDEAIKVICETFNVNATDIKNIRDMKVGIANHSFFFTVKGKAYICRVPWNLNESFMNRHEEGESIEAVQKLGISEKVCYYNEDTGYKIAEFIPNTRPANQENDEDMRKCMKVLHKLHDEGGKLKHEFSYRKLIPLYEEECRKVGSLEYPGYNEVRDDIVLIMDKLDALGRKKVFAHVDPNVNNWLFMDNGDVKLIDWEYSGMSDEMHEIAGMGNYAWADKAEFDRLTNLYFDVVGKKPTETDRAVVYAYNAMMGFLWTIWGIKTIKTNPDWTEYTEKQFKYAKEYSRLALTKL